MPPTRPDRENKLIAEILAGFRGLITHSADKVNNTASTGQAAANSMAVEIMMNGLVGSMRAFTFVKKPNRLLASR